MEAALDARALGDAGISPDEEPGQQSGRKRGLLRRRHRDEAEDEEYVHLFFGQKHRISKRKLTFCTLFGVLLVVPALFVNTAMGYVPILAYLFTLALSFAYVKVLKRSISFSSAGSSRQCTRGESSYFSVRVSNRSILPAIRLQAAFFMSDLFGGPGSVEFHNITLGPRKSKEFEFAARFDHIGTYRVGISELRMSDLLGIFNVTLRNDDLSTVSVQPRIFEIVDQNIAKDAAVEAKKNFTTVINDGMDYSGVREYRWGDPIKAIHWKLSARMPIGEYYTRMYETNANPGLAIIADFDAPEYTVDELMGIYDTVVECAFSLERFADRNGYDAELIFEDRAKRRRRYVTPFAGRQQEILERMPVIFSPGTGKDALGLIQSELSSQFAQSNLIVCTSVISTELAESLVAAKSGKRTPMLFAIIPETCEPERRKEYLAKLEPLSRVGIGYRVVSSASLLDQEA